MSLHFYRIVRQLPHLALWSPFTAERFVSEKDAEHALKQAQAAHPACKFKLQRRTDWEDMA